jgi:hypothetical protein
MQKKSTFFVFNLLSKIESAPFFLKSQAYEINLICEAHEIINSKEAASLNLQ